VRRLFLLLTIVTAVSCDNAGTSSGPPPRKPSADVASLVSLRANQRTDIAITTAGRIYVCQPDADSSVRILEGTEPKYTSLTPARVAQLLGDSEAKGTLRAMTAMPSGELLVYYSGSTRRQSASSLLLFDPIKDTLKVAASAEQLAEVTKMGVSLDLADAQLERAGGTIWVLLRHVDQTALFAIDARQIGSGDVTSWRPIRSLRADDGIVAIAKDDRLFGQLDGSAWLLRPATGELWQLSTEGRAYASKLPPNRPRTSVVPISLPPTSTRKAQRLMFYPFEDLPADPLTSPDVREFDFTRYPAFVLSAKDTEFVIERDAINTRPAYPTYAMRFTSWALDPTGDGVVAYDAMSGEIVRIRLRGV
jgi:hypothetical protein